MSAKAYSRVALLGFLLLPQLAAAHPMGNFSISHYAGIRIEPGFIELSYLIDMAEIPTFQEMQQSGITAREEDPGLPVYLVAKGEIFEHGLVLTLDGRPLELRAVSQNVIFPPGAGNLPTMKFGFVYRAPVMDSANAQQHELIYRDSNFPDRAGWKEVVVSAGAAIAILNSTAPARDQSMQLSNYPTDLLNSPPQDLEARIVWFNSLQGTGNQEQELGTARGNTRRPAVTAQTNGNREQEIKEGAAKIGIAVPRSATQAVGGAGTSRPIRLRANQQGTPRNAFTELMRTQQFGWGIALLAAAIAAGLGAMHALEPGHGKTIVAAYLVGSKGTVRHAVLLGLIVTVSHTAGVYLLGAVTLYAQHYVMPDRLYPILGVLSGLLIAGMGFYLLMWRLLGGDFVHLHSHGPGGHHQHGGLWHSHEDGSLPHSHPWDRAGNLTVLQTGDSTSAAEPLDSPVEERKVSARALLLLGISGGIVPCPAALVVLLSAVALHRVGFGLFLILAFSSGLAAVLIGMGLVAVCARSIL